VGLEGKKDNGGTGRDLTFRGGGEGLWRGYYDNEGIGVRGNGGRVYGETREFLGIGWIKRKRRFAKYAAAERERRLGMFRSV